MKIYSRIYQGIMYVASFFLNFSEPKVIKGENSFNELSNLLKELNIKKVLIVTDNGLHKLLLDKKLCDNFDEHKIEYELFYDVDSNPTIDTCDKGKSVYINSGCDSIVAIGGGSAMDAAKAIGALVNNPKKTISKMQGVLKVTKKIPLLIAIPTTAGTGSEATVASVITDTLNKKKASINDPHLIPKYAVLNPTLLVNLPPTITSTTGMDTLTHAVEAYIGRGNTIKTKKYAIESVRLVFKYLKKSYDNKDDLESRENMQLSAYYGGVAFTRAYIGYVHALAHALGAFYHLPHGLLNAIILPIVLSEYDKKAYKKLSELYDVTHEKSSLTKEEKAKEFINEIYKLNEEMNIPRYILNVIKDEDIDSLVEHAYHEAVPLYPTPVIWNKEKFKEMFYKIEGK